MVIGRLQEMYDRVTGDRLWEMGDRVQEITYGRW